MGAVEWTWAHMGVVDIGMGGDRARYWSGSSNQQAIEERGGLPLL